MITQKLGGNSLRHNHPPRDLKDAPEASGVKGVSGWTVRFPAKGVSIAGRLTTRSR